jgi:hypothetical protein
MEKNGQVRALLLYALRKSPLYPLYDSDWVKHVVANKQGAFVCTSLYEGWP